jgi:hypothetical protein
MKKINKKKSLLASNKKFIKPEIIKPLFASTAVKALGSKKEIYLKGDFEF